MRRALITGVTGQDGSYLAEFLVGKNYEVHATKRRASSFNTARVDHLIEMEEHESPALTLHYSDLADSLSLTRLIADIQPDEIYNLGAQSHVGVSFQQPEYTADVDALGTLRLLEAIRFLGLVDKTRFYQASTSELFGQIQEPKQNESTPFYPRSPYAVAKLYAHWITINYRESYGLFACNGILFNHESPRRGETFVTRKITRGLARIAHGLDKCLYMGNLDALRDWGHAKDYVEMQWLMLQQSEPQDFVIASGQQHSVRDFICWAAEDMGMTIEFSGSGLEEVGTVTQVNVEETPKIKKGAIVVRVSDRYYRPAEVDSLLGDASKAAETLGWQPKITAREMCAEMVEADMRLAKQARVLRDME